MTRRSYAYTWLLLLSTAIPAAGCGSAPPGSDARSVTAAPVISRDNHVEAELGRPFDDVDRCTRLVLAFMELEVTPNYSDRPDREREYVGRGGGRVVYVRVEQRTANTTHLSVSSRLDIAVNDLDHAREIVERIQRHR